MLSLGDEDQAISAAERLSLHRRGYPATIIDNRTTTFQDGRSPMGDILYNVETDLRFEPEDVPRELFPTRDISNAPPMDKLIQQENDGETVTTQDVLDYLRDVVYTDEMYAPFGYDRDFVVGASEDFRMPINRKVASENNLIPRSWEMRQQWKKLIDLVKQTNRQDAVSGEDVEKYLLSVEYDVNMYRNAGVPLAEMARNTAAANMRVAIKYNYVDGFMRIKHLLWKLGRGTTHTRLHDMVQMESAENVGQDVMLFLMRLVRSNQEYRDAGYPRVYSIREQFKEISGNYILSLINRWITPEYNRLFLKYISEDDEVVPETLSHHAFIVQMINGLRLMKPKRGDDGKLTGFEYNWVTVNRIKAWPANRAAEALARNLITQDQYKIYIQNLPREFQVHLTLSGEIIDVTFDDVIVYSGTSTV